MFRANSPYLNLNIHDHLRSLEEEMLQSSFRQNSAELAELLTDDFQEFGSSGRVFDKPAILRELRDAISSQLALDNFEAIECARDVVLVTYISTRTTAQLIIKTLRSSIWVNQSGAWKMRFHQGTRLSVDGADFP